MSVGEVQIVCNLGDNVVEADAIALVLTNDPNISTRTTVIRAVPFRREGSASKVSLTTIDQLPIGRCFALRRYRVC
jgi:hypothetical protein